MAKITDVANAMFRIKRDWIYDREGNKISDEEKILNFFIFNRYFSKTYPEKAQLLNLKTMDKLTAMELWFQFMRTEPYPDNFWSKSPKRENGGYSDKERKSLKKHMRIDDHDLDYLIRRYPEIVKDELTHLAKIEKQTGK
jgi:hypothetical protein